MALARDYIMKPLQKKERNATDLVSIILMRGEAEIIIEREPTTWTLYNKLVDMREWSTARPWGAGNYLPALMMKALPWYLFAVPMDSEICGLVRLPEHLLLPMAAKAQKSKENYRAS